LQAAGRRPDEIAAALGLRRDQVVARLKLMAAWERNRESFAKGMPRNRAIAKAYDAGATWREIGQHFGITAEAASAAGRRFRTRSSGRSVTTRKPRPRA
jgi:uncharacterized protein (DUF433 family)